MSNKEYVTIRQLSGTKYGWNNPILISMDGISFRNVYIEYGRLFFSSVADKVILEQSIRDFSDKKYNNTKKSR